MSSLINYKSMLWGYRTELEAAGRARGTITLRVSHARRCLERIGKPITEISRGDVIGWLGSGG